MATGYMELAEIIKAWKQIGGSGKAGENMQRLILSTLQQLYKL